MHTSKINFRMLEQQLFFYRKERYDRFEDVYIGGNRLKPTIAITIGDAAGIGPEIALKALLNAETYERCNPLLVGDAKVLAYYIALLQAPLRLNAISSVQQAVFRPGTVDVVDLDNIDMSQFHPGENAAMNGLAMLQYTQKAVSLALSGQADAVIGGPHTKKAVELAGVEFDGYPGYVAKLTGTPLAETYLMLVSGSLRIVNATLHVSLRKALDMVKKELVLKAIRAADQAVKKLGVARPRIAVAGLNPHAGEQGMFGREEIEEIDPAIAQSRQEGIDAHGSFGSDTMFIDCRQNHYDAYVAMYHDQAHIPIKLLAFDKVTAFTVGTPVLFCTVGHGSAPDIAGRGIASPGSLLESIMLSSKTTIR